MIFLICLSAEQLKLKTAQYLLVQSQWNVLFKVNMGLYDHQSSCAQSKAKLAWKQQGGWIKPQVITELRWCETVYQWAPVQDQQLSKQLQQCFPQHWPLGDYQSLQTLQRATAGQGFYMYSQWGRLKKINKSNVKDEARKQTRELKKGHVIQKAPSCSRMCNVFSINWIMIMRTWIEYSSFFWVQRLRTRATGSRTKYYTLREITHFLHTKDQCKHQTWTILF